MNAIAERFIGSLRREALDWYIILSKRQLYNILKEYVSFYNHKRPHQGIMQNTPCESVPYKTGTIKCEPILGGVQRSYYRSAA